MDSSQEVYVNKTTDHAFYLDSCLTKVNRLIIPGEWLRAAGWFSDEHHASDVKTIADGWREKCNGIKHERDDALAALAELVRLKNQADAGLKAGHDYQTNQPKAWERARTLLAPPSETHQRAWTGPGYLEQTGYIDPSGTTGQQGGEG